MLPLAFALWSGFVDDALVQGARPAREVRAALVAVAPRIAACVRSDAPRRAQVFMNIEVLAAGFVDRAAAFAGDDPDGHVIDARCVRNALQRLALTERGLEPPTHIIVRLAVTPGGVAPPPGTGPAQVARALDVHFDDIERCVEVARREEPALGGTVIARLTVDGAGRVSAVDVSGGSLKSVVARACIANELNGARLTGGRSEPVEIAWPLSFQAPAKARRSRQGKSWESSTLFDFFGCGAAFPMS